MQKIYVGCSLTHASKEFQDSIKQLKQKLKAKYEVLEFFGNVPAQDSEIFSHDSAKLKACDLFLAECSHPSTGVGFEIATALSHHKPVLAVAQKDAKVSRFILGIPSSLFSFVRYENLEEVVDAAEKKLAGII